MERSGLSLITFNNLLAAADLSPGRVFLLRQQDTRMKRGQSLYRLWRYQPLEFRRYESVQSKQHFNAGDHVASFVIDPEGAAVFAGLSEVIGSARNSRPITFEYLDETFASGAVYQYRFRLDERFAGYEGRLVIEWGPGTRSWLQRAHLQPKPIIELRRTVLDVDWPGYMEVRIRDNEVPALAPNWQAHLSAANGVYLLVCTETGEQYVGAAFGKNGFWGRWSAYANGGHGGNKLLKARKKRTKAPMEISILEVFGSALTEEEAYRAESRWKLSLGSRAHGLNAN